MGSEQRMKGRWGKFLEAGAFGRVGAGPAFPSGSEVTSHGLFPASRLRGTSPWNRFPAGPVLD